MGYLRIRGAWFLPHIFSCSTFSGGVNWCSQKDQAFIPLLYQMAQNFCALLLRRFKKVLVEKQEKTFCAARKKETEDKRRAEEHFLAGERCLVDLPTVSELRCLKGEHLSETTGCTIQIPLTTRDQHHRDHCL